MSLPRVMIGGPVRDREWSIPLWLGGLLDLDYPRHLLTLAVLVNDSRDGTYEACRWWCDQATREGFGRVVLAERNFGTLADNNLRSWDDPRDYLGFAQARQAWIELASDEAKFFSVDSDVQVASHTLLSLVDLAELHELPMLAAVLRNHCGALSHHTNVLRFRDGGATGEFIDHDHHAWLEPERYGEVEPCDVTGACVLLSRTLFDGGLGYLSADEAEIRDWGEDTPFCRLLRAADIRPHFAPGVRVTHWMEPPADLGYVQRADWHRRQAEWHAGQATELGQGQAQPVQEMGNGQAA